MESPSGPGRGSGAGSLVAYSLKITDIDPLKYGLLFERFLNPERVSMPDFDIDFCHRRRDEVISYVTQKYGEDKVGQIITFGTLKARAVIRDVARVLDLPYDEADAIAKLVPEGPKIDLDTALKENPKLEEVANRGPQYKELLEISLKLEGLHRHASTHAAGIVIGTGAADALRAAVPRSEDRRRLHAVHDGLPGGVRPGEDGLPGPEDAHRHRGRPGPGAQEGRGHRAEVHPGE